MMGKKVKSDQLYLNYIMASTYTYISRNIIPSQENKITVEQCTFLLEFLTEFKFIFRSARAFYPDVGKRRAGTG